MQEVDPVDVETRIPERVGHDAPQARRRGKRDLVHGNVEMRKQPQYQPVPVEKEIVIIFSGTAGYLDDVPKEKVMDFERDLYRYMDSVGKKVSDRILKEKSWTPAIEKDVRAMIEEFKKSHPYSQQPQNPEEPKKQSGGSGARPPDEAAKRPAAAKA